MKWALAMRMNEVFRSQSTAAAIEFYHRALSVLVHAEIPFLVGGGYSVCAYTGIARKTKDFDLFVLPHDVSRVCQCLEQAGFRTELTYSHWLAKAWQGEEFIDIIFNSGNGCCPVDASWFVYARAQEIFGLPLKLCPAEETIWQKAFIMERERYDGADVVHLLRAAGRRLDWHRLLNRFRENWELLLSYLVLFGFVYPGERELIPKWVMRDLTARLWRQQSSISSSNQVCRGTLISRAQYQTDVETWHYNDARLSPYGTMSREEIERWNEGDT